ERLLFLLNHCRPQMQRNTDEGGRLLENPSGMLRKAASGGARDLFLQVLWGCSAFYRGCYEIRLIAYVSHGSLLQHLPTISSYLFTCVLSGASLWSMKSAI